LHVTHIALQYIAEHVTFKIMTANKTSTLNLRINPGIKEAVKRAAELEHRSIANFVEFLIRNHCKEQGISISEQRPLFGADNE
jgi:uncharacterized protein (DUF1778 family)